MRHESTHALYCLIFHNPSNRVILLLINKKKSVFDQFFEKNDTPIIKNNTPIT